MANDEISELCRWIEEGTEQFKQRFGTPPTELVMCPRDAEIWRQAVAKGIPLADGLAIYVNPLAEVSGLRCPVAGQVPGNSVVH